MPLEEAQPQPLKAYQPPPPDDDDESVDDDDEYGPTLDDDHNFAPYTGERVDNNNYNNSYHDEYDNYYEEDIETGSVSTGHPSLHSGSHYKHDLYGSKSFDASTITTKQTQHAAVSKTSEKRSGGLFSKFFGKKKSSNGGNSNSNHSSFNEKAKVNYTEEDEDNDGPLPRGHSNNSSQSTYQPGVSRRQVNPQDGYRSNRSQHNSSSSDGRRRGSTTGAAGPQVEYDYEDDYEDDYIPNNNRRMSVKDMKREIWRGSIGGATRRSSIGSTGSMTAFDRDDPEMGHYGAAGISRRGSINSVRRSSLENGGASRRGSTSTGRKSSLESGGASRRGSMSGMRRSSLENGGASRRGSMSGMRRSSLENGGASRRGSTSGMRRSSLENGGASRRGSMGSTGSGRIERRGSVGSVGTSGYNSRKSSIIASAFGPSEEKLRAQRRMSMNTIEAKKSNKPDVVTSSCLAGLSVVDTDGKRESAKVGATSRRSSLNMLNRKKEEEKKAKESTVDREKKAPRHLVVPNKDGTSTILTMVPLTMEDMETDFLVTVDKFYEAGNGPFYALKDLEDILIKEFSSLAGALQYAVKMEYTIVEDEHKWAIEDGYTPGFENEFSKMANAVGGGGEATFDDGFAAFEKKQRRLSAFG